MNIVQIPESTNLVQNSTIVSAINAASDANIVSPSQSQVLSWNNTLLKWENTSITTNDASFAKLTRTSNTYINYTNSVSDGGAFNVFDLFTSNAAAIFTNAGFTAVNNRRLVYTGTTSRIFQIDMFGLSTFTGNSLIPIINNTTPIGWFYMNTNSFSFSTQKFTLNTNDFISIMCSANFQSIANVELNLYASNLGTLNQPITYHNPPTNDLQYVRIYDNNGNTNYPFSGTTN